MTSPATSSLTSPRCRMLVLVSLAISLAHALVAQDIASRDTESPSASIDARTGGALQNSFIAAEWHLRGGHLDGLTIRNKTAPSSDTTDAIELDGPFAIEIGEAGVVRASDLIPREPATVEKLAPNPSSARLSDRLPGIAIRSRWKDAQGRFDADWSLILRQGSAYIRQTLTITAGSQPVPIGAVRMIDTASQSVALAGTVKGSPLVAGAFFLGFESPLSESSVVGSRAVAELHSAVPLGAGQSATYSSVVGVAAPGQMRRSFLAYVERERAHPYRTFLHYNSWFDIGFFTPYSQADALNRIEAIGTELHTRRGVTLDSFLFDDGWDDRGDLWKIRSDFKDGFAPLQQAAAKFSTAPGVWLSPWGGYGPPKQERLAAAKKAGYEIVDGGLALSGPKYYARFHEAVTEMVTRYGVNQFKLDGTGNASQVVKGSAFSSDFDAALHLIAGLRVLKPDLYVNLTTGTYPSPFWLFYADSIWRGGDDTEFAGVGSSRERWITYRDADTCDEIVKAGRLFPLNSLMLHGIVFARKAPHLSSDPGGDFRNEVRSYFGSGTQLQELYITPSLLTAANWDDLAEAARWSRRNAATLVDTHWIGGDPRWLQVYGWAAWSPEKAILTLRNPAAEAQDFTLDIDRAFELPPASAQHYRAASPWAEDASKPSIEFVAGKPLSFHLAPFEVLTLEAIPEK